MILGSGRKFEKINDITFIGIINYTIPLNNVHLNEIVKIPTLHKITSKQEGNSLSDRPRPRRAIFGQIV